MADITIIGHGLCSKCGKQTDIKNIHSFPFPGEEQTETVEDCPSCGFQRVEKAIQRIGTLISDYKSFPTQSGINITVVTETLKPLRTEDFPLLYVELAKLASSPLGEVCFDTLAEIMSAVETDRQFAELRGGHLDEGMAEWYENEARSAAREPTEKRKVIDSIIDLIKIVEGKRKNS